MNNDVYQMKLIKCYSKNYRSRYTSGKGHLINEADEDLWSLENWKIR